MCLLLPDGQRNGYGGPAFQHAINSNLALVSPHIRGADAQAKARAFAGLGGKKRFEDVRQNSGGIPQPVSVTRISMLSTKVSFLAETVMRPPSGVASAALISKFISTCES